MHRLSRLALAAMLAGALAVPGTASAGVVENNADWEIHDVGFVDCDGDGTGETVQIDGTLHVVMTVTIPASGSGRATVTNHWNTQDLRAVGSMGTTYLVVGRVESKVNWIAGDPDPDAVAVLTTVVYQTLIGRGPSNNTYFRVQEQLTVTPSGAVTASFSDDGFVCR